MVGKLYKYCIRNLKAWWDRRDYIGTIEKYFVEIFPPQQETFRKTCGIEYGPPEQGLMVGGLGFIVRGDKSSVVLQSSDLLGPSGVLQICGGQLRLYVTTAVWFDRGNLIHDHFGLKGGGSSQLTFEWGRYFSRFVHGFGIFFGIGPDVFVPCVHVI
jgi:hypothetical protein